MTANEIRKERIKKLNLQNPKRGKMTVAEAGQKGGNTTKERYGHGYYENIGHKGGEKIKKLIQAGKKAIGD